MSRKTLTVFLLTLCLTSVAVHGVVINVPGNFTTIQGAINAAAVSGDEIVVAPGTYNEVIDFGGKAIYLHSSCGPASTIINGMGLNDSVVLCVNGEGPGTILEGFTITGGTGHVTEFGNNLGGGMLNGSDPIDPFIGSSPTVTNCIFSGNSAGSGGGMYNSKISNPSATNCTFIGNSALFTGGGMVNDSNSPFISNCNFNGNSATRGGGMLNSQSSPTVTNCTFIGNVATDFGGGGMYNIVSSPTVVNCTFNGNSAVSGGGGGMFNDFADSNFSPTVTNCILWGDSPDEIFNAVLGTPTVSFSNVQGGLGVGSIDGGGNINVNHLFVDANGPDNIPGTPDDDLHISSGSLVIDAGNNSSLPADTADLDGDGDVLEPIPFDLDGNSRIVGGTVDMGAYEWSSSGGLDSDGDGLLDTWENNGGNPGIPYIDGGGVLQHFPLPGADPMHKNLYVEVDSMYGLGFNAIAQADVIQAFADAPNFLVNNPDGLKGITLHILVDETNLSVIPFPNGFCEFDQVKQVHFGTPFGTPPEQGNPLLLEAKAKAYRYCIFGLSHSGGQSSGLAELPGNDFMVTLGLWNTPGGTPGGTVDQQAGTFMHELGHNLNLNHGGGDGYINKPNYYSVMNYIWQTPNPQFPSWYWRLDYSHVKMDTLIESALVESNGISCTNCSDPVFANIMTPYGVGGEPPSCSWATPNGTPVDWNDNNGIIDPGTVAVDINYLEQCPNPPPPPIVLIPCPTPGQTLNGYADWSNLRYALGGHSNFNDGVHTTTTIDTEMTLEMFELLSTIPPPPVAPCLADVTPAGGNGVVNIDDLVALLSTFGPCPAPPAACVADITPAGPPVGNGVVNIDDLVVLLGAFGPCP